MKLKQWYKWVKKEDFDIWHKKVIKRLGLPIYGVNQKTGYIDKTAAATTSYTHLIEIKEGDYRAMVEEHIANQYKEGLGVLSEAPPLPNEIS